MIATIAAPDSVCAKRAPIAASVLRNPFWMTSASRLPIDDLF